MVWSRPWKGALLALVAAILGAGCSGEGPGSETETEAAQPDPAATSAEAAAPAAPGIITSADLVARLDGGDEPVILDVRTPEEYAAGHIPGAINVPYDQIDAHLDSLASFRGQEVVVYCRTGRRAGIAEAALSQAGFSQVLDLEGHMRSWQEAEHPVAVPAADCC